MVDVSVLQIQVCLGMNEWRQSDMLNTGIFQESGPKNFPGFKINLQQCI